MLDTTTEEKNIHTSQNNYVNERDSYTSTMAMNHGLSICTDHPPHVSRKNSLPPPLPSMKGDK